MADVSFNEEQSFAPDRNRIENQSFFIRILLKSRLVGDEKSAKLILGIVALILFSLAILLWFLNSSETKATPTSEVLRQASQQQFLP